jgi:hypothetical protein
MRGLAVGQGEEPHQVSRFQLTRTDFPTLGSEKNPDLRPQHSKHALSWQSSAFFASGSLELYTVEEW